MAAPAKTHSKSFLATNGSDSELFEHPDVSPTQPQLLAIDSNTGTSSMEHRVFAPPNPAVIPADRTHPLYRFDDEAAQSPDTLALFTAAGEGDLGALRAVLARGVDVNATDYGWTPLAWAVAEEQLPAVSELLRAGADPNAGNIKADPLCCAVFRGRKDIILALLRAGASLDPRGVHGQGAALHGGPLCGRGVLPAVGLAR